MRVVHVLRKPLSEGTVAANTLKHGCGGLNIDASRVHSGPSSGGSISGATALGQASGWNAHANRTTQIDRSMSAGRWPANVILQHLDGCRSEGTKQVRGGNDPRRKDGSKSGHNFHGFDKKVKHDRRPCTHTGFGDDGKETVANWVCVEGCPVRALDEQSGVLSSGDTGGASRFFRQVGVSREGTWGADGSWGSQSRAALALPTNEADERLIDEVMRQRAGERTSEPISSLSGGGSDVS